MSRPAAVPSGTPNGPSMPPSIPIQSGMQIVNMRPTQGIQMTGGRGLTPRMIVNQIPNVRPAQAGQLTLQTLPGLPPGTQGHLIVKTDNGQLQLVRVNTSSVTQGQITSNGTPTTGNTMVIQPTNNTYRFQQPQMVTAGGTSLLTTATLTSTTMSNSVVPSSNIQQAQSTPTTQTISAESAKTKCKNFLATLLRLANEQHAKVAQNVRSLIQGLIDGKVEPEAFTEELQKDLNSSPQPCLVPFLKKTLPYLRTSLAKKELSIDGVIPPPLSAVQPMAGSPTVIPTMTGVVRSHFNSDARVLNPNQIMVHHRPTNVMHSNKIISPAQVRSVNKTVTKHVVNNSNATTNLSSPLGTRSSSSPAPNSSRSKNVPKDDKKSKSQSYNNVGDDDINDVAAMGGVNLGEESQRILDSTGFVGTHIRSCKDETFLPTSPLHAKLRQITSEHNLDDPSKEVITLMSHAVQERLKTLVEKLGVIAEHRLDVNRATDARYEVSQDVKGQIKFIEEVDKLERKRKDEYEREILLRAAKSRSKSEDPEQVKLKAKAKEMQRVELEEVRQREANLTAMNALQGPRKKAKLDPSVDDGSFSGTFTQKQMPLRPRLKRVNLRDMIFLMEQEKGLRGSNLLYRAHLK